MKILKYTKLKSNQYKLLLDNDLEIKLYDDVIVKYDLIRNKELDDKKLEEITNYNNELEAYYKAIKYITTRLRTEKEIYKKLSNDYDNKIINKTIKKLKEEKYLNNDIYLKCYVDDQVLLNNIGPNKIKDNLLKLGLYEEDINNYLEGISREVWIEKLENDYDKKIILKTIKRLKDEKYLNNDIYLKCYVDDQVLLNNIGPNKIKENLLKLGLYEEDVNDYLNRIDRSVWINKLEKIISKKINSNHSYSINKLKEKLLYDLSREGFYKNMIEEVIDKSTFNNDNNLLEKEYDKLYNKLSKKYESKELEYQIKNKLLQKGFYYDDISNLIQEKKNY